VGARRMGRVFQGALVAVGTVVVAAGWALLPRDREPDGEAAAPAAVPAGVIPPGREHRVMDLLAPLVDGGLAGRGVEGVRIEGDRIRVALEGDGGPCEGAPGWVEPPGALELTRGTRPEGIPSAEAGGLVLALHACAPMPGAGAELDRLARAFAARHRGDIWEAAGDHAPDATTGGLLEPAAGGLGLRADVLLATAWALGLLACLLLPGLLLRRPPRADPPPPARRATRWLVAAVLLAGGAHAIHHIRAAPFETDEAWARPTDHAILAGDHDAWVHPPLYRAAQQTWGHAIGHSEGDPDWLLRVPSLLFALGALALVGALALRVARSPWAALPLALPALSPLVAGDAVHARPYGLAAALVTAAAVAAWHAPDGDAPGRSDPWRARLLLSAVAMAAWADLVAGLAACIVLVSALAADPGSRRRRLALAACVLPLLLPLVPGGLEAITTQVQPTPAGPDLAGVHELSAGGAHRFAGRLLGFGVVGARLPWLGGLAVGLPVIAALLALAWRSRRSAVVAVVAVALLLVGLSEVLSLRPRNVLFFPYLLVALAVVVLPSGLARLRRGDRARSGPEPAAARRPPERRDAG